MQLGHLVGDGGDQLDPAGRRADHRHALARERHRRIPLRGVERRAAEAVAAGDLRQPWLVQLADRTDENVGDQ